MFLDAVPSINDPTTFAVCLVIALIIALAFIWAAYARNGNPGGPDWRH